MTPQEWADSPVPTVQKYRATWVQAEQQYKELEEFTKMVAGREQPEWPVLRIPRIAAREMFDQLLESYKAAFHEAEAFGVLAEHTGWLLALGRQDWLDIAELANSSPNKVIEFMTQRFPAMPEPQELAYLAALFVQQRGVGCACKMHRAMRVPTQVPEVVCTSETWKPLPKPPVWLYICEHAWLNKQQRAKPNQSKARPKAQAKHSPAHAKQSQA